MAKPVANFIFNANGLSVVFTDRSSGIINTWAWNFGFQVLDVQQVSSLQNPPAVVFPNAGAFIISLTVTNGDGANTFTFPITVEETPGLNTSIKQMVQYNLPVGLAFDSIGFDQAIRGWQLYLQPAPNPPIADADVFTETKWPPLYNILISKLIIMDLVVKASTASMASFIAAAESFNSLLSQTTTGTMQVADYTIPINQSYPITINLLIGNGVSYGASPALANTAALVNWLNALGIGLFAITTGDHVTSLGNNVILTTFNYTSTAGGVNGAFTQSNVRVVPIIQNVSITGGLSSKGTLKALETGPSKAQWYDPSVFWSTIFKSVSGANGTQGGIMGAIQGEICLYAGRLTIQLPGCTNNKTLVKPFIVAKGRARNPITFTPWWPVSNERSSWFDRDL